MISNVQRYYDRNTRRFLRFGQGAKNLAIHRAVWAEGVRNRFEAMDWIHEKIAHLARKTDSDDILDIGCGVGGSIITLSKKIEGRFLGITVSPVQAELGNRLLEGTGLLGGEQQKKAKIIRGDFTDLEAGFPHFDLAFAVESYLHIPNKDIFFANAASCLRAGGRLVLCDDFLQTTGEIEKGPFGESRGTRIALDQFRRGWCAEGLTSLKETKEKAGRHGFILEEERDLTPHLELGRPRDMIIRGLVFLLGWLPLKAPFWSNLLGGNALQKLLGKGILGYWYLVLRRE